MGESTKRCPSCGIPRALAEWGRNRANSDGLQSNCNPCRAKRRERDREQIRERDRQYTARHRNEARARARTWRAENIERAKANSRSYYLANKDRWAPRAAEDRRESDRAYRVRHAEKARAYAAEYYRLNPEKFVEYSNRRRARMRQAEGDATAAQIAARIAYFGGRCWICGDPWRQVDHVKPLAKGGSNWPSNLRPICQACNARKKARWYGPSELDRLAH